MLIFLEIATTELKDFWIEMPGLLCKNTSGRTTAASIELLRSALVAQTQTGWEYSGLPRNGVRI